MGVTPHAELHDVLVSLHKSLVAGAILVRIVAGLNVAQQVNKTSVGLNLRKLFFEPGYMVSGIVFLTGQSPILIVRNLGIKYEHLRVRQLLAVRKPEGNATVAVHSKLSGRLFTEPVSPLVH